MVLIVLYGWINSLGCSYKLDTKLNYNNPDTMISLKCNLSFVTLFSRTNINDTVTLSKGVQFSYGNRIYYWMYDCEIKNEINNHSLSEYMHLVDDFIPVALYLYKSKENSDEVTILRSGPYKNVYIMNYTDSRLSLTNKFFDVNIN